MLLPTLFFYKAGEEVSLTLEHHNIGFLNHRLLTQGPEKRGLQVLTFLVGTGEEWKYLPNMI